MKTFYITTSIAYVNAPPHIGYALELIQADVLARYHRQKLGSQAVFYLTGTDEHGAKVVKAAEAAGKTPRAFTDEISERFRGLKSALNLSWNEFLRTTEEKRHFPVVAEIWGRLVKAGDIYKKRYQGLYCVGHEAFVTEKDLMNGQCADHNAKPEIIEEENYFFRLSKYSKIIGEKIKSGEFLIAPEGRRNELLSLIEKEGLEDVSFSRPRKDLSWGIPVPGDETQTIYVWCDALTNYISGYGGIDDWQKHPADVQIIGKDILRFHGAIWPGMLLSAGLPLPKILFVHGFITVEGRKMSKSLGNVLDPFELVKKYGADAVRYYLLREIPSFEDGDFSYFKFEERYNADLANGIGNFASRVLTLANGREFKFANISESKEISEKISEIRKLVNQKLEEFKFSEALAAVWELISFGDKYVNEKKPWENKLETRNSKLETILNLIVILDNVAALLKPFLPETAEEITSAINWEGDTLKVKKIPPLFPRLLA